MLLLFRRHPNDPERLRPLRAVPTLPGTAGLRRYASSRTSRKQPDNRFVPAREAACPWIARRWLDEWTVQSGSEPTPDDVPQMLNIERPVLGCNRPVGFRSVPGMAHRSCSRASSASMFSLISRMTQAGIAGGEHPLGLVTGHDAAGADDRARADPHTRADDRPATDPDVRADLNGFAVLDTASQLRVHRVQGRIDLHGRSEHGETADPHFAVVEHDAVVVEADRLPKADVEAIIAEERRLDADGLSPPPSAKSLRAIRPRSSRSSGLVALNARQRRRALRYAVTNSGSDAL